MHAFHHDIKINLLMNAIKDYVTIHLRPIQIDVMEIAILFVVYLIKYMF